MHIAAATEAWAGESVAPTADFALPMGAAFDTVVRLIGLGELPTDVDGSEGDDGVWTGELAAQDVDSASRITAGINRCRTLPHCRVSVRRSSRRGPTVCAKGMSTTGWCHRPFAREST